MGNTALDLEAIKARCEAATKEPWARTDGLLSYDYATIVDADILLVTHVNKQHNARDANIDFIMHARTDIPALVAEIERLREELELHKELYVFSENDMGMMRAQRDGARDVCAFYRKQLRTFADHCKAAPSIRCWSTRYWLKLRALTKGKKNG